MLVSVDHAEPTGVVDRSLWRDARQLLDRHAARNDANLCVGCGQSWPCAPRRLAERAEAAAYKPWNEVWTARHDLHSLRTTLAWPDEPDGASTRHSSRNRGLFDRPFDT